MRHAQRVKRIERMVAPRVPIPKGLVGTWGLDGYFFGVNGGVYSPEEIQQYIEDNAEGSEYHGVPVVMGFASPTIQDYKDYWARSGIEGGQYDELVDEYEMLEQKREEKERGLLWEAGIEPQ